MNERVRYRRQGKHWEVIDERGPAHAYIQHRVTQYAMAKGTLVSHDSARGVWIVSNECHAQDMWATLLADPVRPTVWEHLDSDVL